MVFQAYTVIDRMYKTPKIKKKQAWDISITYRYQISICQCNGIKTPNHAEKNYLVTAKILITDRQFTINHQLWVINYPKNWLKKNTNYWTL